MNVGAPDAVFSVVTPGAFAALGIPLKRGRDFNDADGYDAPFTTIVSESLARKAFPGQDPLGRVDLLRPRFDEAHADRRGGGRHTAWAGERARI